MDAKPTITTDQDKSKLGSVDASSIIENKKSTKEYWERRMMAEMTDGQSILIESDLVKVSSKSCQMITSTPTANGKTVGGPNYMANNDNLTSKLGSDGESEASPECSLSPVEVDSLEGGSSSRSSTCEVDRQSSPDYADCAGDDSVDRCDMINSFRDCESSPDAGIAECSREDCSSVSPTQCVSIAARETSDNNQMSENSELETVISISDESGALLTPVTEESNVATEPDSLEEFMKHETECLTNDPIGTCPRGTCCLEDDEDDNDELKESLYEEIKPINGEEEYESETGSSSDLLLLDSGNNKQHQQTASPVSRAKTEDESVDLVNHDDRHNLMDTLSIITIPPLETSGYSDSLVCPIVSCEVQHQYQQSKQQHRSNDLLNINCDSTCDLGTENSDVRPTIIGQLSKLSDEMIIKVDETIETSENSGKLSVKSVSPVTTTTVTSAATTPSPEAIPLGIGKKSGKPNGKLSGKSTAESMIAEEIRQLKEREEELQRMRSQMKLINLETVSAATNITSKSPSSSSLIGSGSSSGIKSISSQSGSIDGKSSPALSDLSSCSVGTISNDSIDPAPSKPISLEILNSKASAGLAESPIERELRAQREREQELKMRNSLGRCLSTSAVVEGQKVSNGVSTVEVIKPETIVTSNGTRLPVFKQNSCGVANAADIQKLLATTRIQQEIEEQTQRELALKATGSIKTISQERTDLKVTKMSEIEKPMTMASAQLTTAISSKSPPAATANVSAAVTSISSEPRTAKASETNGSSSASSISSSDGISAAPGITRSSSNPMTITMNAVRRTSFQPFFQKGMAKSISMHKFISSKGKSATPSGGSSAFYPLSHPGDLYSGDLRPPVLVKGEKGFRRGSVSVESKIQEELKEMKAREEELRRQRARLLGLSQPNLNLIGDDDGVNDQNGHGNGLLEGEGENGLKRTTSNPNISHDAEDKKKVCQLASSLKPRKNPLIAQWEEKIIKDSAKESIISRP